MGNVVRVQVTEQHISEGSRGSSAHCPIARALCDLGFRAPLVSNIDVNCIPFHGATDFVGFPLPVLAQQFVSRFDEGRPVEPMEFDIYVPENVTRHTAPTKPVEFKPLEVILTGEVKQLGDPIVPVQFVPESADDAGDVEPAAVVVNPSGHIAFPKCSAYVPPPAAVEAVR